MARSGLVWAAELNMSAEKLINSICPDVEKLLCCMTSAAVVGEITVAAPHGAVMASHKQRGDSECSLLPTTRVTSAWRL